MNDPAKLAIFVREALAKRTHLRLTEIQLFGAVADLAPDKLTVDEFRDAVEWNQSRNYIDRAFDDDRRLDTWALTKKGKVKQGL